jgi:general secretion pathway protein K
MKSTRSNSRGIALIVVMIAVFVLSLLAAAFAYSMRIELRLARNSDNEEQLLWLGRSGVERAKWILSAERLTPNMPHDSLKQVWAGGAGEMAESNSPLSDVSLDNFKLGDGVISLKIVDHESKVNVNTADAPELNQALTLMGVDAGTIPFVTDSILDWIDRDDEPRINGAESEYYQSQDPPYYAKNGPIDDLSELLLVRSVTQEMYWGPNATNHVAAAFQKVDRLGRPTDAPTYQAGLVDIFTPLSSGKVNINTASATVLQMIPGIDENIADAIVRMRDDQPFDSPGELINAGVSQAAMGSIMRYCDVRSSVFDVQVTASVGGTQRIFQAVIGRNPGNPRDLQVLSFSWN